MGQPIKLPRFGPSILLEEGLDHIQDFIPARAWLHIAGLKEVFRDNWQDSAEYFVELMGRNFRKMRAEFPQAQFAIASVWGDTSIGRKDPCADLFLYHERDFGANMSVALYNFRGYEIEAGRGATCEDTLLVLGKEAEYRRGCNNVREYMRCSPSIEKHPEIARIAPIGWREQLGYEHSHKDAPGLD